jgi:hypothetical protein
MIASEPVIGEHRRRHGFAAAHSSGQADDHPWHYRAPADI